MNREILEQWVADNKDYNPTLEEVVELYKEEDDKDLPYSLPYIKNDKTIGILEPKNWF